MAGQAPPPACSSEAAAGVCTFKTQHCAGGLTLGLQAWHATAWHACMPALFFHSLPLLLLLPAGW